MPALGRPQAPNAFGNVSMGTPVTDNSLTTKEKHLKKVLGLPLDDQKFVDPKEHNKLGQEGFLKLLTHQLANQDPLSPMEQKELAADLAQFSQLEQLAKLNAHFEKSGTNGNNEYRFYGTNFLGKEVETMGTTLSYDGQVDEVGLPFYLPRFAESLTVNIFNDKRELMAQIKKESIPSGNNKASWDGKGLDGIKVRPGRYFFEILAYDEKYQQFRGETKTSGMVTGVHFEEGETILTVDNNKQVFLRDVKSFKLPGGDTKEDASVINNLAALKKNAASSYHDHQEAKLRNQ